jgi:hypothetical protein
MDSMNVSCNAQEERINTFAGLDESEDGSIEGGGKVI